MKILIVSNLFPPVAIGGYEIACKDTFELLANKHDCYVLTSLLKHQEVEQNDKVFRRLELFHSFGIRDTDVDVDEVEKLNELVMIDVLKVLNPDLIYFWNINGVGFSVVKTAQKRKIPYCFHLMDESLLTYSFSFKTYVKDFLRGRKRKLKNLSRYIKNPIFISKYIEKRFNNQFSGKSTIIYPFLDLSKFAPKKNYTLKDIVKAVYLGQLEVHKGVVELCECIEHYNKNNSTKKIHLTLFGKSSSGIDKKLIDKYSGFIEIIQGVPREKLLKDLASFDIGFFPSVWEEPFGIAQIELLAAGVPVVSSGRGGSCELLTKNEIMFSNFSKENFELVMKEFINNYEVQAPVFAQNVQKVLNNNHTIEVYSKLLEDHFKKVLEG